MKCKHCGRPIDEPVCFSCGTATAAAPGAATAENEVRKQVFEVVIRQAKANHNWQRICALAMQVNNITAEEVSSELLRRASSNFFDDSRISSASNREGSSPSAAGWSQADLSQAIVAGGGTPGPSSSRVPGDDSNRMASGAGWVQAARDNGSGWSTVPGERSDPPAPVSGGPTAIPDSAAYQELADLRTKLLSMGKDGSVDALGLRNQLLKVASELEETLLHLQQELTRLQSSLPKPQPQPFIQSGFERELERTTKPIEPAKSDDKYRVDWKPAGT